MSCGQHSLTEFHVSHELRRQTIYLCVVCCTFNYSRFEACYLVWSRFNRGCALCPSSRSFRVHYEERRRIRTGAALMLFYDRLTDCEAIFSWCIWNNLGGTNNILIFTRTTPLQSVLAVACYRWYACKGQTLKDRQPFWSWLWAASMQWH